MTHVRRGDQLGSCTCGAFVELLPFGFASEHATPSSRLFTLMAPSCEDRGPTPRTRAGPRALLLPCWAVPVAVMESGSQKVQREGEKL
eukprot:4570482-Prymnesium_polylepis.1